MKTACGWCITGHCHQCRVNYPRMALQSPVTGSRSAVQVEGEASDHHCPCPCQKGSGELG